MSCKNVSLRQRREKATNKTSDLIVQSWFLNFSSSSTRASSFDEDLQF